MMLLAIRRACQGAALGVVLAGCAHAPPSPHTPADAVRVDKAPPPATATLVGPLRAVDGHGCGLFGTLGTYEGAVASLQSQAYALGADYVRVTRVEEPHAEHDCVHKEYVVEGVAYRRPSAPRPPAPAPAPSSATLAPTRPVAPEAARAEPQAGLLLGATGFSVRAAEPSATASLSLSARLRNGAGLEVWLERPAPSNQSTGLKLVCDPRAHRLALLREPAGTPASVAPEPFELDDGWHAWRIERAPDRVSVWLDERLVLLYASPAPSVAAGFEVGGEGVELRQVVLASAAR